MSKRGVFLASVIVGALTITACSGGSKAADNEFPSFVYSSAESLASFRTAVANKDMLAKMPCYCGCAGYGGTQAQESPAVLLQT